MESEGLIWVVVLGLKCLKIAVDIRVCKIDFYVFLIFSKLCFMFVAIKQNLMSDVATHGFTCGAVRFAHCVLRTSKFNFFQREQFLFT
jgi:hypothetical protein